MKSTKKLKRLLILVLAFAIVFAQYTTISASTIENVKSKKEYIITTPYEYPVKLRTNEWKKLKTHDEKISICQIPDGILKKMTTEALVETVLNYPLRVDMLAWSSPKEGYHEVYSYFNGLQELASRLDSTDVLKKHMEKLSTFSIQSETGTSLEPVYIDIIINGINMSTNGINMSTNSYPVPIIKELPTPSGRSVVQALFDQTWEYVTYWYELTQQDIIDIENMIVDTYPRATRVSTYNIKYNCHSYAWYSTSPNLYWIDNPMPYMQDGSYRQVSCAVGTKVFYDYPAEVPGEKDHSGIVVGFGSGYGGGVVVQSKWSYNGVYIHDLADCPYSTGRTCTFWKR